MNDEEMIEAMGVVMVDYSATQEALFERLTVALKELKAELSPTNEETLAAIMALGVSNARNLEGVGDTWDDVTEHMRDVAGDVIGMI